MCFVFSSKPNTRTGHISINVLAGIALVAKTPLPVGCLATIFDSYGQHDNLLAYLSAFRDLDNDAGECA